MILISILVIDDDSDGSHHDCDDFHQNVFLIIFLHQSVFFLIIFFHHSECFALEAGGLSLLCHTQSLMLAWSGSIIITMTMTTQHHTQLAMLNHAIMMITAVVVTI